MRRVIEVISPAANVPNRNRTPLTSGVSTEPDAADETTETAICACTLAENVAARKSNGAKRTIGPRFAASSEIIGGAASLRLAQLGRLRAIGIILPDPRRSSTHNCRR